MSEIKSLTPPPPSPPHQNTHTHTHTHKLTNPHNQLILILAHLHKLRRLHPTVMRRGKHLRGIIQRPTKTGANCEETRTQGRDQVLARTRSDNGVVGARLFVCVCVCVLVSGWVGGGVGECDEEGKRRREKRGKSSTEK